MEVGPIGGRTTKLHGVSGGILENKWFGADVWPAANGYTLLHSGRLAPSTDDAVARREGVGLALDAKATAAWRMVGEVWRPISSRVIMAKLKLA